MTNNSKNVDLRGAILKIVNEKHPQTVRELTKILQENLDRPESEIVESILKLQAQGSIQLGTQNRNRRNLATFVTGEGLWYLLTIALGAITATLVFTVPENLYPLTYARNFFGVIFILFLPGYAFVKAIFPIHLNGEMRSIETIERIVLSVGLSIALVSMIGILLYYSPWKLEMPAIVLSLFAITSIFATAGIVRENR